MTAEIVRYSALTDKEIHLLSDLRLFEFARLDKPGIRCGASGRSVAGDGGFGHCARGSA